MEEFVYSKFSVENLTHRHDDLTKLKRITVFDKTSVEN
jgi:hypothetical protein